MAPIDKANRSVEFETNRSLLVHVLCSEGRVESHDARYLSDNKGASDLLPVSRAKDVRLQGLGGVEAVIVRDLVELMGNLCYKALPCECQNEPLIRKVT